MAQSLYRRLARRFDPESHRFNRREFLNLALASAAATLAGCRSLPAGVQRRAVIIGAGFSGLACAHELRRAGFDVTVLEARRRVGGRVLSFTDFVPGKVVEGGAELIGSNHPTWVAYARRFGLRFLDVTEDENLADPVLLGGRRLTEAEAKRLYDELDAALNPLTRLAADVNAEDPWLSPEAARLDRQTVADWVRSQSMSELCRTALTVTFAADNNQDTSRQSLLGLLTQIKGGGLERFWTESEVYRCRGGNQQLAFKLAAAIGSEHIRLATPVASVELSDAGGRVTCADGTVLDADDIVLAVPPTVWHRIRFSPALPEGLRPQVGTAIKVLTAVRERFWRRTGLGPYAITDGMLSMTWDPTDNQTPAEPAGLTAFSGGPAAERCRQAWREGGEGSLRAAFEALYPGHGAQMTGIRFMDWPSDEWAGGGYSAAAPGEITTIGPRLRSGMGRLQFVGEHACPKFAGYMEGALNSGVALAKRLSERV